MTLNKFFDFTRNKQKDSDLYQRLVDESIQIKGVECKYILRDQTNIDNILNEDSQASFSKQKSIEIYIENFEGFDGDDALSKFGLQLNDELTFSVSTNRFNQVFQMQPRVGDLIWLELAERLFEIKWIDDETDFYSLGKNRMFRIRAEIFDYAGEEFNTGIEDVDVFDDLDFNEESSSNNNVFDQEDEDIIDFTVENPLGRYASDDV